MAAGSIGAISAGLGDCFQKLESVQVSLGEVREMAEALLEACRELGVEGTATRVEDLLEQVNMLSERLDGVKVHVTEIIAQAEAIGGGRAPSGGGSSGGGLGGGDPRAGLTAPSRAPDAAAVPEGDPEEINARGSTVLQESIRIQNQSARIIAAAGYRIRQLPKSDEQKSPDYEIEGRIFDCYAPGSDTKADGIRTKIRAKLRSRQADRFVVSLERSPISVEELRGHLARMAPTGLQEVLAIKNGAVRRVWP